MKKRKRRGVEIAATILALGAVALAAALFWRALLQAPIVQPATPILTPAPTAPPPSEDFSATERQSLDEILRHKSADR